MNVRASLEHFVLATERSYPELETVFDDEWRSPCEIGEPYRTGQGEKRIAWRPTSRQPHATRDDFTPLERALDLRVHPDIKAYYAAYWSAGLEAEAMDGHVSLLFLWNPEDIERLNENLIGHAMAKRQSKSPMSIFFACTDPDSDLFLSVDNDSGAVILEKPGEKPLREVAPSLASFLDTLVPNPPETHA